MFIIDIMMAISNWLWGWPLLILTSAVAVYLSVRFKFFQFTRFGHAMKNTFGKIFDKGDGEGDISPFQACCTALASTLGVGNIAGVSVAIATGGPGAVFWMWAVALMGFIVKFSEITLGMAYRERDPETGRWHGGFYWYVRRGLGKSWKWLGIFWAVILGCAMVFAPAVQANSVVEAIRVSFDVPGWIVGVIFAVIMAVVLVGGIKSISSFAEKVVPLMALAYVIGSIFILVKFGSNIPHVFAMIFEYAFTPMAATGGFAGSTVMLAIRWGLARGVYSNEAGTGMAPLAHSSSSANHPVKQGLWGISEVFVDTIIVCTMTALVVLCTGVWTEGGTGAALTATAFGAGFGNAIAGTVFVVAIITFFAFTTALVNVYYGEICMTVLGGKKFILPYRLLGCAFAIIGSVGALSVLWNLFDFFFGVCAVCNLVVCFLMRKQIGALYSNEAGTGMAPLAHSSSSANHPVKQGLWGISEVFVDTIIVCTMTALVVLCTGVWTEGGTGAALTATAFGAGFGNAIAGTVFVVAIITFFAFTTALVNVYYGEICMTVLGGKKFILPYRLLGCAFAIIGSVGALSVLWNLFDFFFGVCAVCNLVVCFLMRKQIGALINDYLTRLKSGKWEPTSEAAANAIPELWVNDKAAK